MKIQMALITLLLVSIIAVNIQATDVCGTYDGDSTWSLAESPYNIICQIVISGGASLNIEPGVEVNFIGGAIVVQGGIFAYGVTFQNETNPEGYLAIHATGHGYIKNCYFEGSDQSAIYFPPTADNVEDFEISGNTFDGFQVHTIPVQGDSISINITYNRFLNCNVGIYIYNYVTYFPSRIYNNCFESNGTAISNNSSYKIYIENNWWNSTNGPSHIDNPSGDGDVVYGNVDFLPWLINPDCNTGFCLPGNANDDCTINIFDITYLIKYLYLEGPSPINGCDIEP